MKRLSFALFFCGMMIISSAAVSEEVGKLVNLVGTASLVKKDGTKAPCKVQDKVEEGDSIVTEKGAFAMVRFVDGGEMILRPDTNVKITQYKFKQSEPQADKSEINLVKGGLRRLTGMIGKRGDKDADKLVTATATAGIRGTVYDTLSCQGDCDKLKDGTYFRVKEGEIVIRNDGGELSLKAGQFSLVNSSKDKAEILPKDPGLPKFNPDKSMQNQPNGSGCPA